MFTFLKERFGEERIKRERDSTVKGILLKKR
jgi:hypothetical protein